MAPMGKYKDFQDCLNKNKDKDSPEKYCGAMKSVIEKSQLFPEYAQKIDYEEQMKNGIKMEMEHTDDEKVAKQIAFDHLKTEPRYYIFLKEMEKLMKETASKTTYEKSVRMWQEKSSDFKPEVEDEDEYKKKQKELDEEKLTKKVEGEQKKAPSAVDTKLDGQGSQLRKRIEKSSRDFIGRHSETATEVSGGPGSGQKGHKTAEDPTIPRAPAKREQPEGKGSDEKQKELERRKNLQARMDLNYPDGVTKPTFKDKDKEPQQDSGSNEGKLTSGPNNDLVGYTYYRKGEDTKKGDTEYITFPTKKDATQKGYGESSE